MKKTINARIFVKPQHIEDFKKHTTALIESTRKEKGCLFYNLYQSLENPSEFLFHEQYQDQQAVDLHMSSTYLGDFLTITGPLHEKDPVITII